jgi:hypothetical protein
MVLTCGHGTAESCAPNAAWNGDSSPLLTGLRIDDAKNWAAAASEESLGGEVVNALPSACGIAQQELTNSLSTTTDSSISFCD